MFMLSNGPKLSELSEMGQSSSLFLWCFKNDHVTVIPQANLSPHSTSFCPSGSVNWATRGDWTPMEVESICWSRTHIKKSNIYGWGEVAKDLVEDVSYKFQWVIDVKTHYNHHPAQLNRSYLCLMCQVMGNKIVFTLNAYVWLMLMIRVVNRSKEAMYLFIQWFLPTFF